MATNVFYQESKISREARARALGNGRFRGCTIWFTGLSGAGKSTIAFALEQYLIARGVAVYTLDGDNIRHGLNSDLGFSEADREQNIRRVAEVARLFADAGLLAISSFISPFRRDRDSARRLHEQAGLRFFECFVDTPLEVCESRDTKGLYAKARTGLISGFTGIDQPYEVPERPEILLPADCSTVNECVQQVLAMLLEANVLDASLLGRPVELFARRAITSAEDEEKNGYVEDDAINEPKNVLTCFKVPLTEMDVQWAQVLAEGWASPLKGFMRESEYLSCLHFGTIRDEDGGVHSQAIPIVLSVSDEQKDWLAQNADARAKLELVYDGKSIACLTNVEVFPHRKQERVARIFGTTDRRHPTVNHILGQSDWLIGGDLTVYDRIRWNDGLDQYRLKPVEIRQKLQEMRADAVFVFQLRNPVHNGHALLMNDTRRMLKQKGYRNPVLLLHPLGGWTKDDDVPLPIRIRQHLAILNEGILDPRCTLVAIFPSPMSYAGPKEVQWHAKARVFTGSDFYIVGRDPAGINHPDTGEPLYVPTDGAQVLSITPGLRHMQIIPFRVAAFDKTSGRMDFLDSSRTHDFEFISGTKMRTLARTGQQPPAGFMGSKAWQVLADYYNQLRN